MRLTDADVVLQLLKTEFANLDGNEYEFDEGIQAGLGIAIDTLAEAPTVEQPRWIPVKERLPRRRKANGSIYEICNLWHKGGYATAGRFHWGKMTWTFMPWDGTRVISVPHSKGVITHWQPLPAPPAPEEFSAVGKED